MDRIKVRKEEGGTFQPIQTSFSTLRSWGRVERVVRPRQRANSEGTRANPPRSRQPALMRRLERLEARRGYPQQRRGQRRHCGHCVPCLRAWGCLLCFEGTAVGRSSDAMQYTNAAFDIGTSVKAHSPTAHRLHCSWITSNARGFESHLGLHFSIGLVKFCGRPI